ncbi:MAG: ribonuclease P protein component 4 [Candidatus Micrarchaeia archaeon]
MVKNSGVVNAVASWRISRLARLAEAIEISGVADSEKLAKKYVRIAREISSHYGVRIPGSIKARICKCCGSFMVPGFNCSVRLASSGRYVVYKCACGCENHITYSAQPKPVKNSI